MRSIIVLVCLAFVGCVEQDSDPIEDSDAGQVDAGPDSRPDVHDPDPTPEELACTHGEWGSECGNIDAFNPSVCSSLDGCCDTGCTTFDGRHCIKEFNCPIGINRSPGQPTTVPCARDSDCQYMNTPCDVHYCSDFVCWYWWNDIKCVD